MSAREGRDKEDASNIDTLQRAQLSMRHERCQCQGTLKLRYCTGEWGGVEDHPGTQGGDCMDHPGTDSSPHNLPWMYDRCIAEGMLGHAEGGGGGCIVQLQLVGLGLGVPGNGEAMSEARVMGL